MICIDTSVWIEFFRGGDDSLVLALQDLLEEGNVAIAAPVWIEILSAARKKERDRLGKLFSALPRFYPSRTTWKIMEQWTKRATEKGHSFGMGDLLIGAIASENDAKIWSLDSDFTRMAQLKFVRAY
jgi:predicted nucleic acid-binding protein